MVSREFLIKAESLKAAEVADRILVEKHKKKNNLVKKGKFKRHYAQRRKLNTPGFGATYQAPQSWFRAEFCWWDKETDEESEYQVHWVACRKFSGEERKFLMQHIQVNNQGKGFIERETIESQYVLQYIVHFICICKDQINQAFVYPASKKDDEAFRDPLYQIRWSPRLCPNGLSLGVRSTLYGCIEHFDENNSRLKILDIQ